MAMSAETVVVTGALGNLGRAVVETFSRRGANVVMIDSAAPVDGKDTAATNRMFLEVDLLDEQAVEIGIRRVVDRFGTIDALCNVAGGFWMGRMVHEMSPVDLSRMVHLNVVTMLRATHAVVPHMIARRTGYVVNVAANAGTRGTAGMGAYSAAKSMVVRLTESMAEELRHHGIAVNCVLPTIIDTPQNRSAMPDANVADWVTPDALAEVIAYLCTPQARALRGTAIPVAGGTAQVAA